MATFSLFSPALPGQTVTAQLRQGVSATATLTVTEWGSTGEPPPGASLTVTARVQQGSNYAPSAVHLYADVSGTPYATGAAYDGTSTGYEGADAQFHNVEVMWFTGDTGQYLTSDLLPVPAWRDKSKQYGWIAKHVYHAPKAGGGNYEVSCVVYDKDGRWGLSNIVQVPVVSKTAYFGTSNTIVVSTNPSETWGAPCPSHSAINRCTTMQQAIDRVQALKATAGRIWVAVRNGDTFENWSDGAANNEYVRGWPVNGDILFSTWEEGGARATFDLSTGAQLTARAYATTTVGGTPYRVKMQGINYVGTWDIDTNTYKGATANSEAGTWRRASFGSPMTGPASGNNTEWIVADCDISDFSETLTVNSRSDPTQIFFMSNVRVSGCRDFILIGNAANNGRIALIGTTYEVPDGYVQGMHSRNLFPPEQHAYNAHSGLREGSHHEVYLRACYMYALHGWSGANDGSLRFSIQPLLRINDGATNGGNTAAKRVWICDSVFIGLVGINGRNKNSSTGTALAGVNAMFENCLCMKPTQNVDATCVNGFKPLAQIRNNLFIYPNVPTGRDTSNTPSRNAAVWPDGHTVYSTTFGGFRGGALASNVNTGFWQSTSEAGERYAFNNTLVVLRSSANDSATPVLFTDEAGELHTTVQAGNIVYAPNRTSPITGGASWVRDTIATVLPNGWFRRGYEAYELTLSTPVPIGGTTPTFSYGQDWTFTNLTAPSFSGSLRRHTLVYNNDLANGIFRAQPSNGAGGPQTIAISVEFLAGGFRITNLSPIEWQAAPIKVGLDRGLAPMAADYHPDVQVPANTVGLYRTATAVAPSGSRATLFDMERNFRKGGSKLDEVGPAFAGALAPAA